MKFQALQSKREAIAGKVVIGIDPGKQKHQASACGGSAFSSVIRFPSM